MHIQEVLLYLRAMLFVTINDYHPEVGNPLALVQNLSSVTASNMLGISGRHNKIISIGPKKRPIEITQARHG